MKEAVYIMKKFSLKGIRNTINQLNKPVDTTEDLFLDEYI